MITYTYNSISKILFTESIFLFLPTTIGKSNNIVIQSSLRGGKADAVIYIQGAGLLRYACNDVRKRSVFARLSY